MRGRPRLGVLLSVWLLGGADAAEAYAQRAEPGIPLEDRVDVVQVDRRLLAVRSGPGGGVVEQRLELGERVLAIRTRGLIGVATTNVRLLGVTSGSSGWHELRYRVSERGKPPPPLYVGERVTLVPLPTRLVALRRGSTAWQELTLGPSDGQPRILPEENLVVALTNRRAIAFSSEGSGFVQVDLDVREAIENISLQESSATLTTNRRVLLFRIGAEVWTQLLRRNQQ